MAPRNPTVPHTGGRTMKRTFALFLGAILLVGASAFAAGAEGVGGHARMMHHRAAFLTKTLNLTADQQVAAKKLHEDGSADAAAIGQKTIDAHATGQQLKALHDDFTTKFSALLNPDQLTKFQQIQAAHPAHGHPAAQ